MTSSSWPLPLSSPLRPASATQYRGSELGPPSPPPPLPPPSRTNGSVYRISSTVGHYDYCISSTSPASSSVPNYCDENDNERRPLLCRRQQQQQQLLLEECDVAVFDLDHNHDQDQDQCQRRTFLAANEIDLASTIDDDAANVCSSVFDRSRFAPATFYGAGSEMATTTAASTEGGGGGGGHRVIYCVHGKPEGCCATVLSESNSLNGSSAVLPSPPITLFEDHCHQSRETKVDRKARTKLIVASVLCLLFMIAEIVGGVFSRSLAIATDAAHLLTDFGSFMISLFALWVGSRPATRNMPFGWYRAEVLGALTSVLMIWVVTGVLLYVAVERVLNQQFEIQADVMLITSAFGVCVNIVMAFTLHQHHHHHHHHHQQQHGANDEENTRTMDDGSGGGGGDHREQNINVRAAYIHVIGDFIQSFGVLIASVIIYYKPEWKIVDPICTFGFSILVLFTTFAILRDTMIVLMEGIPRGIDFCDVLNTFLSIDGVLKVHNLRIWALSLDKMALAAHLAVRPGVNTGTILKVASRKIHQKFNFFEMTLQIEEFQEQMANCKQCQDPLT